MADDPKPTQFNKQGTEEEQMSAYQKKMADIKSRGKPVGGAPPVKIPPLNADPITGPNGEPLTMAEQAEILRDPRSPLSPHYNPALAEADAAVQREQAESMDPYKLRTARQGQGEEMPGQGEGKGPFGGTLPPEAAQDPNFRPGVGSMYAQNQPGMQQPGGGPRPPGAPKLSDETVEGLQALKDFNAQASAAQEEQAKEGAQEQVGKDVDDRIAEDLGLDDDFMREMRERRQDLDTKELQEAIEKRCKPMTIDQLIEEGELRQAVPIVREKFIVEFRTISGEEDLAIKRELYIERNAPDIYLFDKLNMMQLAAGVYSINGRPLPDHLNDKRRFDKEAFLLKFRKVNAMPLPMLASLSINYTWFDRRARKLFVDLDELKNG
ncbi:MAG: hypothetical protein ACYTAO_02095 [Planctomycetota bacterium]|jgi:hypothetical protein